MKASFMGLSALSLACAPMTALSAASARAPGGGFDSMRELTEFCQILVESDPDPHWTRGTCAASLIAGAPALDTFVCISWERDGVLQFFGFETFAECVKSGIAEP